MPGGITGATSVEYGGYIYEIGGYNGTIYSSSVYYTQIGLNGVLGTWNTESTVLSVGITGATSVEYGGYIYEIGGYNGTAYLSSVYYSQINEGVLNIGNNELNPSVSINALNGDITSIGSENFLGSGVYGGNLTASGNLNISGVDTNTINGNTLLTQADLNIQSLSTPTGLSAISSISGGELNAGTYYYEVVAENSNGQSLPSQLTEITTLPVAVPTGVSASVGTSGSVGSNLVASTTYYYEITATTSNGETTVSSQVSGIEGSTAYPITLNWVQDTGATGYKIYKSTTLGGETFLASVSGGSTITYTDSGNIATTGILTPSTNTATTNTNQISLSWNSVPGATYYDIYRSTSSTFGSSVEYVSNTNSFIDTNISQTTSLPETTVAATSVEYNGYVYEIGGIGNGAIGSTVYYAPINSNGTFGTWTTTTSLPEITDGATSVEYNGYVYEIGGYNGSAEVSNIYYALINSNGSLGAWTTTTSLPEITDGATSVEYNGYVYEIGGYNGSAHVSTVYYALINSNGSLGAWNTTTSLPETTVAATSVEYNGYVYEIGGYTGSTYVSSVYYAPINSNGTLGTWNTTTSLPEAIDSATSVEYNGYVYEIGGYNGSTYVSSVYYAPINSNGTLGTWSATTSLPEATESATSVEYNGYVYEIGGVNYSSGYASSVYYFRSLNEGGFAQIAKGSVLTNLQTTQSNGGNINLSGDMNIGGGLNVLGQSNFGSAINLTNPNNTLISASSPLDIQSSGFSLNLGKNNYISQSTSSPSIPSWPTNTSLPEVTTQGTSVEYNGYVYEIGGYNFSSYLSEVYYAPINSNGSLGVWNTTTSLPETTDDATSVEYNGYVYEIGGYTGSTTVSTVYYAPINSNGTLGAWNTTTSLPETTENATSVKYNGYVYEIGGYNGSTEVSNVYYAPINSNGTLGTWSATTSLPEGTYNATSVKYNGYVYEIGGYNGSTYFSTVYYALINSNGTVGTWNTTTSLPEITSEATSVEYNGYVYEMGGIGNDNAVSIVYYAPINSNGTLGTWSTTTSLPNTTYYATSVEYNGYVYEIGGFGNYSPTSTIVYSSSQIVNSSSPGDFTISSNVNGGYQDIFSLDPYGNAIFGGGITTGGIPADLAENVIGANGASSGDIVSITSVNTSSDSVNNFTAIPTTHPYSSNTLGVISTNPSITLHQQHILNSVPLALAGRVMVKVTNYNGNITTGDMITGSIFAGFGEVANSQGQVVGMALNSLTPSTPGVQNFTYNGKVYLKGEILMLVKNEYYNPIVSPSGILNIFTLDSTNNTINIASNINVSGTLNITGDLLIAGHIVPIGTLPQINPNLSAGVGASAVLSTGSTDISGNITLTTGTTTSLGSMLNLVFTSPYKITPIVIITPNNSLTGSSNLGAYVSETTTGFSLNFTKAPISNSTYSWNYVVIQ